MEFRQFIQSEELIEEIAQHIIDLQLEPESIDVILNEDFRDALKRLGQAAKSVSYETGKSPTRKAFADPSSADWKKLKSKIPVTKGNPGGDLQTAMMAIRNAVNKMSGMQGAGSNINLLDRIGKQLAQIKGGMRGAREDWQTAGAEETLKQLGRGEEVQARSEKHASLERSHGQKIADLENKKATLIDKKAQSIFKKMDTLPPGAERRRALKSGGEVPPTPAQAAKIAAKQAKDDPAVKKMQDQIKKHKSELTSSKRKIGKGIVYDPSEKEMEKRYPYPFLGWQRSGEFHKLRPDVGGKIRKSGWEYGEEPRFPSSGSPEDVALVPMDQPITKGDTLSPEAEKARQAYLKSIGVDPGEAMPAPDVSTEEIRRHAKQDYARSINDPLARGAERAKREREKEIEGKAGATGAYEKLSPWQKRLVDMQRKGIERLGNLGR